MEVDHYLEESFWETDSDDEEGMRAYLQQCVEAEALPGAAHGIAQRAIEAGLAMLSHKQATALWRYAFRKVAWMACLHCHEDVAWADRYDAYRDCASELSGTWGLCPGCAVYLHP